MDNALRKAIRSILDEMADWSDKGTRGNLDKITTLATTPVREATQQESPSRQLLFDDSEDRFDQRLSPFVRISSFVGRHPDTMTA